MRIACFVLLLTMALLTMAADVAYGLTQRSSEPNSAADGPTAFKKALEQARLVIIVSIIRDSEKETTCVWTDKKKTIDALRRSLDFTGSSEKLQVIASK